jgi:excisionase family DNA binding protein
MNKRIFSTNEVAEILGKNPESIRHWIKSGYIPAVKLGGHWRISSVDLNTWWRSRGGNALFEHESIEGLQGASDE